MSARRLRVLNLILAVALLLPANQAPLGASVARAAAQAGTTDKPLAVDTLPEPSAISHAASPAMSANQRRGALAAPPQPPVDRASVDPAAGGTLRSSDDNLTVRFPSGATSERLEITNQALPNQALAAGRMVRHFALDAYAADRQGALVHRFQRPVEITVNYSEAEVRGLNAASLRLHYRDEGSGQWVTLPTTVDLVARTATASLDHFSHLSLHGDQNISAPGLIEHFQNDLHSGAATAEYPIVVPPGPGSFQPRLNLTYNSGRVDEMKSKRATGSWVGFGWALDPGRVSYDELTGRRFLQMNGQGHELLQDGGGAWHTKSESYYRILFESNTWKVWDRDGVYYEFGGTTDARQFYKTYDGQWHDHFYRWDLNLMRDTHGNQIVVEYFQDLLGDCSNPPDGCQNYVRAAYPRDIYYGTAAPGFPKGRVNVHFDLACNYNDGGLGCIRIDDPRNADVGAPKVMETRYLTAVKVYLEGALVRQYDLRYEFTPASYGCNPCQWFSGNIRLVGLTRKGSDGVAALPEMTLGHSNLRISYLDNQDGGRVELFWPYLTTVDNGYGGGITYTYVERNPNTFVRWTREVVASRTVNSGFGVAGTTTFSYYNGSYEDPTYLLPDVPNKSWYADAEYRGFNHVVATDPAGNTIDHYFYTTHADPPDEASYGMADPNAEVFTGREYRAEYRNAAALLLRAVDQTYYRRGIYGKINFVGLSTRDDVLGGNRSRTTYEYDGYGNVSYTRDYDQLNNLYRYREAAYYPNTTSWIVDRLGSEVFKDAAGQPVEAVWYGYDNGLVPSVVPVKGDLTLARRFLDLLSDAGGSGAPTADTSFTYDSYGSRTTEMAYAAGGYVYLTTGGAQGGTPAGAGSAGYTTSVAYDATNTFPATVTYPLASHGFETTTYNRFAKVESHTDPNGALTNYDYDAFGRALRVYRPGEAKAAGHSPTVQYAYDDAARPAKLTIQRRTDLGGAGQAVYHTTIRYFDGLGRLIQERVQAENGVYVVSSLSYDALGRKDKESVPVFGTGDAYAAPDWANLKKTTYTYDTLDRVLTVTGPDNVVTTTTYDGWTTKVVDGKGHCKESDRDAFGRLVAVREYSGTSPSCALYATTTYTYDTRDRLKGVTDTSGSPLQSSIVYDFAGRKTSMDDPDLGVWSYRYEARGNLRKQTDARGTSLLFSYDAENRLMSKGTASSEPISAAMITQLRADINARREALGLAAFSWTDPVLSSSTRIRMVHFQELRDALRGITGMGNVQYAAGEPSAGRTIRASDIADLRRWTYGDGTYTQPMAATASFGYDDASGGNYGKGRRTSSALAGGGYNSTQRYDARGRVSQDTQTVDGVGYVTAYPSYDALDRPRSMTYPGDETATFGYNDRMLLNALGSYVTSIGYNAFGKPTQVVNGASISASYGYDPNHLRLSDITFSGSGAPNLGFNYTYDNVGNVHTITENGSTTTFTYDHLDRLTDASGGYSGLYRYDALGDLETKVDGGTSRSLSYNLAIRPKHAPKTVDGVTQTYDANGNLVGDGTRTFSYDSENRLVSATSGGNTVQFAYDPDGKRIKKTEGGQTTVYVGKHYEKNTTTGAVTQYYEALGQPVAMWQTGVGTTYLYRDHLGSTSAAGNGSTRSYWPFGSERSSSGTTPTDRRYTGQQWNSSVGLYYYGARFYDPAIGRFVSPDTIAQLRVNDTVTFIPLTVSYADTALVASLGEWNRGQRGADSILDPQLLNRYSYSRNNPTTMYDPSGKWVWVAVGAVAGGIVGGGVYAATHWDAVRSGNVNWVEAGAYVGAGALAGSGIGLVTEVLGVSAAAAGSPWALPAFERARVIEERLGRSPFLVQNFPAIDRFEKGIATSIKSLDLNAATYQNVDKLTQTVRGYIDKMAAYQGQPNPWGGFALNPSRIAGRSVDLAIPAKGWTQAQIDALLELQNYAQSVGVALNTIHVP